MSTVRANLDIYRPPGGRTERRVAAEVVARLLEAGLLAKTPAVIACSSAALGVPVSLIQEAWSQQKTAMVPFDNSPPAPGDDLPGKEPSTSKLEQKTPRKRAQAWNERQRAKKEPAPGKRLCSRCGPERGPLPKSEFNVKRKMSGQLHSMCKSCQSAYAKDRYLSSERQKQLGAVLRFVLSAEDEHCGFICPDCRLPCKPGEEVVASDAVLHHADHHRAQRQPETLL